MDPTLTLSLIWKVQMSYTEQKLWVILPIAFNNTWRCSKPPSRNRTYTNILYSSITVDYIVKIIILSPTDCYFVVCRAKET